VEYEKTKFVYFRISFGDSISGVWPKLQWDLYWNSYQWVYGKVDLDPERQYGEWDCQFHSGNE
jgi:hypothetical protein